MRFNPLKVKRNLFYVRLQCIVHNKHSPFVIKNRITVTYKVKVTVCSKICTKTHNTMRAPCRIFEVLNLVVCTVTARL